MTAANLPAVPGPARPPLDGTFLPVVLLATALSRLPFIAGSYGSDPDAWRVAFVARQLWEQGAYDVSRFPGYPLHEIAAAPFVGLGGATLSNIFTLLLFLAALTVWHSLVRTHARSPRLLTAAFAFTPLLWLASSTTLDYAGSLFFLLLSMHRALADRPVQAGLAAGVMTGFRPSNALLAVVPLLLLPRNAGTRQRRALVLATAAASAVASFLPVLIRYGATEWVSACVRQVGGVAEPALRHALMAAYRGVDSIGPAAALLLLAALVSGWTGLRRHLAGGDRIVTAATAGLVLLLIGFFALPAERGYLVPGIPLLLLLVDRTGARAWPAAFAAALLLHGFVNFDTVRHSPEGGVPGLNVRRGMLLDELAKREAAARKRAYLSVADLPDSTVVLVGSGPPLWVENPAMQFELDPFWLDFGDPLVEDFGDRVVRRIDRAALYFLPVLSRDEAVLLRRRGFTLACTEDVTGYVRRAGGIDLDSLHVAVIPLPDR